MESEDREGREGRGRTKGFGTRAGRRATRRAGRRGSRRGRLNLTFKKKEKRRKAHIVGLDSRGIVISIYLCFYNCIDHRYVSSLSLHELFLYVFSMLSCLLL